jgi:hypothetical protein
MMNDELGRQVPPQWALAPAVHHSSFLIHHFLCVVVFRAKNWAQGGSLAPYATSRLLESDIGYRRTRETQSYEGGDSTE